MKIQIVIPTINLWHQYTKDCIQSVQEAMIRAKTHGIDSQIILIDNNSIDETKEEASKMESELFHYHRSSNDERWGFQRSVNFGVCYGLEHGAEFILVLNNDIVLHPEVIWRLVERFEKGDVGMVTCMDVRGEMHEKGIAPVDIKNINAVEKEIVDEAPNPNFSAFCVSKDCWEFVGEFDELFYPAYFEDNDYHRRMFLSQVNAIVLPAAMFYHYGSRTQNEGDITGPIVPGPLFENIRAEYVKKWGGKPGEETFLTPYNEEKSLTVTKQKP
jgi:GT2 family glycosyltransferase